MPRVAFSDPLTSLVIPPSFSTVVVGTASATPVATGIRLRCGAINSSIALFLGLGPIKNGEITYQVDFPTLASFTTMFHVLKARVNAGETHDVDTEIDYQSGGNGNFYLFDDNQATQIVTGNPPTITNSQTIGVKFTFIGYMATVTIWNISGGQDETTGSTISGEGLTYQTADDIAILLASDATLVGNQDLIIHDLKVTEYLGPYPVALRGTLANTTAGTNAVTLTNPTLIAVGNLLALVEAVDNSGTAGAAPPMTAITDARNAWTRNTGGLINIGAAANSGSQLYLATAPVLVAYQAADTVTPVYTASPAAKAIRIYEIANVDLVTPLGGVALVNGTGTATATVTVGPITPPVSDRLLLGIVAEEAPNADTITTWDVDVVDGGWLRGTPLGSTNATAISNQKVLTMWKAVIAGGVPQAQNLNMVLGTARDWAGSLALIKPPTGPAPLPHNRRADMRHLIRR